MFPSNHYMMGENESTTGYITSSRLSTDETSGDIIIKYVYIYIYIYVQVDLPRDLVENGDRPSYNWCSMLIYPVKVA